MSFIGGELEVGEVPTQDKGDAWLGLGGGDVDFSPSLTSLDLSWRTLARLPKGLKYLTSLTELRLAGGQISLPNSSSSLTSITSLDLSYSSAPLPSFLSSLPRLRSLLLAGNPVASLPPLALLQTLDLHGSRLSSLPAGLSALCSLTALHLSRGRLVSLPAFLSTLPLRIIDVSFNQLTSLEPILVCPLRQLRAQGNALASPSQALPVPSSSLILLDLSHNSFSSLPQLAQHSALIMLYLAHNSLRSLPSLSLLTRLCLLDASHNRLRSLPDLSTLVSLRSLLAHCNRISTFPTLPPVLHITQLSLSANKLSSIPALSSATTLLSLSITCNRLACPLHLPSSLTSLFAAHNSLPRSALSSSPLPLLEELSLSNNPLLRSLKSQSSSTFLRHLHLSACSLKRCPPLAASAPSLRSLHLAQNARLLSSSALPSLPSTLPELLLSDPLLFASASIAFASALGRRPQQEDAHLVHTFSDRSILLALFDGHGGTAAAHHAATHLVATLTPLLASTAPSSSSPSAACNAYDLSIASFSGLTKIILPQFEFCALITSRIVQKRVALIYSGPLRDLPRRLRGPRPPHWRLRVRS